ncbi:MAG: thioredoxin domain-containing protein [Anaerolineales bacterium]|nr:thioredoxin domain-containing protein [Anaerolineales bacterium]
MDKKRKQARSERRQQEKRKQQIRNLILIGVGALIVVGFLVIPNLLPTDVTAAGEREHPLANDNAMGNPDAPVKIEVFSDFQCIHCLNFYESTEAAIVNKYVPTGQVYYVYRSFGPFLGPESQAAAEAAYCAGDQGKFWEYHDTIFANYESGNAGGYSTNNLIAFAETAGLDEAEFRSCFNSGTYANRVNQDYIDGQSMGASGTPAIFINGELAFAGAPSVADFQNAIEAALAAQ